LGFVAALGGVGGVIGVAVYIGELKNAMASEGEKHQIEVKALEKEVELREKAVRGLMEKEVRKERELREMEVGKVRVEAQLHIERKVADFMTKGEYSGVLKMIEDSQKRRDDEKQVGG